MLAAIFSSVRLPSASKPPAKALAKTSGLFRDADRERRRPAAGDTAPAKVPMPPPAPMIATGLPASSALSGSRDAQSMMFFQRRRDRIVVLRTGQHQRVGGAHLASIACDACRLPAPQRRH